MLERKTKAPSVRQALALGPGSLKTHGRWRTSIFAVFFLPGLLGIFCGATVHGRTGALGETLPGTARSGDPEHEPLPDKGRLPAH